MPDFIFFEKSPRNVSAQTARVLFDKVRGHIAGVAVTVDAPDAFLDEIVSVMRPAMLQLHGAETPERVAQLKLRHGTSGNEGVFHSRKGRLGRSSALSGHCRPVPFRREAAEGRRPAGRQWRLLRLVAARRP